MRTGSLRRNCKVRRGEGLESSLEDEPAKETKGSKSVTRRGKRTESGKSWKSGERVFHGKTGQLF